MLRDPVTLTFNLLTLDSGNTWPVKGHVINSFTKLEDRICLSHLEYWIPLSVRLWPLRMRRIT